MSEETTAAPDKTLEERVVEVIDRVRPYLQRDGGDIDFLSITEENVVRVKLQGACAGCPMSQITLSRGVEAALKEEIPEIDSVENCPDA
ncbi:MAG TPA: NifU family protein [Armatimonadota bacterium]|jgi:Fe-S cluster biogenesis protein NfuA|nr:NifU family protein [Armatimonadota bacterium]